MMSDCRCGTRDFPHFDSKCTQHGFFSRQARRDKLVKRFGKLPNLCDPEM